MYVYIYAPQVALVVKNLPANAANAGDTRDAGLTPGLKRSAGGGHGNPLQHSFLDNPMDRGAWCATVCGVAKSQSRLKRLSTAQHIYIFLFFQMHTYTHTVVHFIFSFLLFNFSFYIGALFD